MNCVKKQSPKLRTEKTKNIVNGKIKNRYGNEGFSHYMKDRNM